MHHFFSTLRDLWAGVRGAMPSSPQGWSAVVAIVALIWTMITQTIAWRRDRYSRGVESLSKLDERFETAEFRAVRKSAAAYLLTSSDNDTKGKQALRTVLNLFENIGFLYRMEMVTPEMVWHYFGSWLLPYVFASGPTIKREQHDDPLVYCELEAIFNAVSAYDSRRHPKGGSDHVLAAEAIRRFLQDESELSSETRPSTMPA